MVQLFFMWPNVLSALTSTRMLHNGIGPMPRNLKPAQSMPDRSQGISEAPPLPRTRKAILRPDLIEQFERASEHRLITLCDIAGSGKTTAVLEWAKTRVARGDHVAWLGLSARDNDLNSFLQHLCEVFDRFDVSVPDDIRNLLKSAPISPFRTVIGKLFEAIAGAQQRVILVLDDLHLIRNTQVISALEWLVENAPMSVQFVFATREKIPLKISRFRALDQVFEFARGALRFNTAEIKMFLEHQLNETDLSEDQVEQITKLTNGWPVALQFIVLSYRQSYKLDLHKLTKNTPSGLFSFLKEDVLEKMSQENADFLVRIACLPKITQNAVASLFETADADAMLAKLADQGFLEVENPFEYRFFHPLFHDFLENELGAVETKERQKLRHRASAYYMSVEDYENAMDQLIKAQNFGEAAKILETEGMSLIRASRIQELKAWLEKVPKEVLDVSPRLEMFWIWILFHLPHTRVALRRLVAFMRKVRSGALTAKQLGLSADDLDTELRVLSAGVLSANGKSTLARQSVLSSMRALSHRRGFNKGTLCNILAYSELILGDVTAAREASRLGFESHNRGASVFGIAYSELLTGIAEIEMCQPYKAANSLRRSKDHVVREIGPGSYAEGLLSIAVAETKYGWNQLEEAEKSLAPVMSIVRESGSLLFLLRAVLLQAKLHAASQNPRLALRVLEELELEDVPSFPLSMRHCIADERVRILLAQGDLVSARIALKSAGIDPDKPHHDAVENLTIGATSALLAKSRLLIAEGRFDAAVSTLEPLRDDAISRERRMTLITVDGLIAIALYKSGARLKTADILMETMRTVASEAVTRPLIDLGADIIAPLEDARDKFRLTDRRTDLLAYCSSIIRTIKAGLMHDNSGGNGTSTVLMPAEPELLEPLTEREEQVAQLLADGKTNPQISKELSLSVDTVKWHLKNIFQKLGVSNRTQAVIALTGQRSFIEDEF